MKTISEIIRESGMCERPEYYSGYGVSRGNINEEHLLSIYEGIKLHKGKTASEKFCQMVDCLELLTATSFLIELHNLDAYHYSINYDEHIPDDKNIVVGKDENGEYDINSGIAGILTSFLNNTPKNIQKIESTNIVMTFFEKIGFKPKYQKTDIVTYYC